MVNTAGTTTFAGAVGNTDTAVTSVTTDAAGTTAINGATIKTTGIQTYNDAVTLGADTTLTGTTITTNGTVSGSYALAITGNAVFGNSTNDTVTLGGSGKALSVSGTTAIYTSAITTSGAQTYTGNACLLYTSPSPRD